MGALRRPVSLGDPRRVVNDRVVVLSDRPAPVPVDPVPFVGTYLSSRLAISMTSGLVPVAAARLSERGGAALQPEVRGAFGIKRVIENEIVNCDPLATQVDCASQKL